MWYLTWITGVLLACSFAILHGVWLEQREADKEKSDD